MESLYEIGAFLNLLPTVSAAKIVLLSRLSKTLDDSSLLALAVDITKNCSENEELCRKAEHRLRSAGVLGPRGRSEVEDMGTEQLTRLTEVFLLPLIEFFCEEDEGDEEEPDYTEEGPGEVDPTSLRLAQLERPALFLSSLPRENADKIWRLLPPALARSLDELDLTDLIFPSVQLGAFLYSLVRVRALELEDLLRLLDGPVKFPASVWDRLAGVITDFTEPVPAPVEVPRVKPSWN